MPTRQMDDRQAGFTLIETMIAIVVLAFGLIAVTNLFLVAASSNYAANQTTAAANLASEQLERLMLVPFTDLAANTGGDLDADAGLAAACPGGAGEFSCYQEVRGSGDVRLRWVVAPLPPGKLSITVEALPMTGLAAGWARVRLSTIRTCTAPPPAAGAACPPIV